MWWIPIIVFYVVVIVIAVYELRSMPIMPDDYDTDDE